MAAADGEALAIYGADKLTNVDHPARRLREPKATRSREEFKVPLELKLEIWEADLALLREKAPELPSSTTSTQELSSSSGGSRSGSPAPET